MEEIKASKKERKFLKAVGKIAGILLQEFILGVGRKFIGKKIDKMDNRRQLLIVLFALFCNLAFASLDSIPYPITGNKQRLGYQTTGNGLVYRGKASDTITKPTNYVDKNVKAYLILDSVSGSLYVFKQGVWAAISGSGGGLTMPFDSITFNTAKDGTVGVGEVEYNDTQGSLIQGLKGGNVTNVIGQQLHQRVNNKTGGTLAKGTVVYLSGSQGNRITVAKALATSDPTSANTFGIVAEQILDNESGYVITEGLITNINTMALTQDSAVYLSGTTAGALTSTKPQAPIHGVYIGVCVKSNAGSGELFVKIRNGQELDELHDVVISSPVDKASLYYKSSEGLWRDTTAALLVSDTTSMLANYALKGYVDSIAQNFQDSIDEITNGYFKQEFPSVTKDTLNWTKPVQLPIGGSNLLLVYRNGQMINDGQYSVIDTNKVKINSGSYKVGENYTVVYVKGGGGSGGGGTTFDTTLLNLQARLDLKLNISDTLQMLANYATKAYADTTGRFYARQEFRNVSSSTLTWTQSDTLVVNDTTSLQVYRNGQILLPNQYTVPTKTTVVIAATSYKAGENYTVILPRGGGAGSGGGSGSLTSISGGTGINVSPNPITTTGTVSADLTVLMELSDTVSLSNRINLKLNAADTASLSNRINTKLNISDTSSMLAPYFRDADTTSLNLTSRFALKLNAKDTASLSNRINLKGSGTVTSVATGYGLTGGTITNTGTLVLDSAVVFSRIRDSIVNVAIGNDTIKILKQEYAPATSSILTWTVTSKFPIQSKSFILVFRNGQLLINDQYNLTDTNKITIVSNSFKLNSNYTVVTVSGIGSVGSAQAGNPVYPDAGIALSTGSTWASSIPNNSTNWNTAYNDKINSLAVTGTTTKTITLTQQDGGTVTGNFTDNGLVTSVNMTVPTGLSISGNPITTNGTLALSYASGYSLPTDANQNNWTIAYNDKIASLAFTGTSTKTLTLNQTDGGTVINTFTDLQGFTGTGVNSFLPRFTGTSTLDSTRLYYSNGRLGINMDASEAATHLTSRFVVRDFGHNFKFDGSAAGSGYTSTFSHDDTGLKIGHSSNVRDIRFTLNGTSGLTIANNNNSPVRAVGIATDSPSHQLDVNGTFRASGAATLSSTLAVTGAITEGGNNVMTNLDTVALSNRINGKVSLNGDETINGSKSFNNIVNVLNGMTISGSVSGLNKILGKITPDDRVGEITVGTGLTLSSNTLNANIPTERYYINLGIVAGAADNSASTYDYSYPANIFIIPTSLNGYCIDSVYIRAIGCSTCPPVSPDLDYYVGVYKANAGARVTTSGASLQGSQITMNEYDLNQVNVNYSLSTGEAWWVYLNGTYTSDMAYITAGFVVKKTCN